MFISKMLQFSPSTDPIKLPTKKLKKAGVNF